jgi:hypothetical protein
LNFFYYLYFFFIEFGIFSYACYVFVVMVGDQGIYNSTNRPVMGPPVPKIEGGVDACSRNNWLPHMHLPHCKNFFHVFFLFVFCYVLTILLFQFKAL